MKIYFCGSIRGGRQDADLYFRMINALKQHGTVLTEHVGSPSLTDKGGDGGSDYIWRRDTDWLRKSDIVIAECSTTSMGVGYEIAFAEALGIPVYAFYGKQDGRLSAMIGGNPNLHVCIYESEQELFEKMHSIFQK